MIFQRHFESVTIPSTNLSRTCLRVDVSYFQCCTRKKDVVPFLRATKLIRDVCTQASCTEHLNLVPRFSLLHISLCLAPWGTGRREPSFPSPLALSLTFGLPGTILRFFIILNTHRDVFRLLKIKFMM